MASKNIKVLGLINMASARDEFAFSVRTSVSFGVSLPSLGYLLIPKHRFYYPKPGSSTGKVRTIY